MIETDTQVNRVLISQWAWIPLEIRKRFTPTSVVSILFVAFSCGAAVTNYRAKFHAAERSRVEDHRLLVKQAEWQTRINETLIHVNDTLTHLDGRMSDQEQWRRELEYNAEHIVVPKQSHRTRKP